MKKVNLLIIGAGRSGTTSLCLYLAKHSEICFSDIKEVHYFSIKDLHDQGEKYLHSYFSQYNSQPVVATADTYLLIDKKAPKRVFEYNPEMKLIVLFRDPIDRAYSSYHYAINNGYQNSSESFIVSCEKEKDRIKDCDIILKNNLCHNYGSLYYKHLRSWMEYFPKENFLLLHTSEFETNYLQTLTKISTFLKITPFEDQVEIKINKASPVKSKKLQQFLLNRNHPLRKITRPIVKPLKYIILKTGIIDWVHRLNKTEKNYRPLTFEERQIVGSYLKEDVKNLKDEFDIDFNSSIQ